MLSWSSSHLRGRLIDGEDTGGELPEAGEPDVELAPVREVHALEAPAIQKTISRCPIA
jgi:hypothetical protein